MLVLIPPPLKFLISSFTPFVPDLDQNKTDAHEELILSVKRTEFQCSRSTQNISMLAFARRQLSISFISDALITAFLFRLQIEGWEFGPGF